MKRKKWSELEEQTLLTKYSDLVSSGTLPKLKTREKKFKPIADHVNSVHNLHDPIAFPFKWTWRDVSIKIQNMRHQYLGVKQKIRLSNGEFNWKDGENHWENFMKYKEVFGDVEIEVKDKRFGDEGVDLFGDDDLGLGFGIYSEEIEEDCELGMSDDDSSCHRSKRLKKLGLDGSKLGLVGAQVVELRDVVMRREERRKEREWSREMENSDREERRNERAIKRRIRFEKEFEEEKRRRMKMEEKREEEELKWREKMVNIQIEHEKQMMQMHADSCSNQMQILGAMTRLVCQFFGSANDGLGSVLPAQVLQHSGSAGLDDNGKPGSANLPSGFL